MTLIIQLAWRNLFRNGRRTMLTVFATSVGMASIIFADAFMIGMSETMIESVTDTFIGEGQVTATSFRDAFAIESVIPDAKKITNKLDKKTSYVAYTPRLQTQAMLATAANSTSVMLNGIDPIRERKVSKIAEAISDGTMLTHTRDIIIGKKLAKDLSASIGDRIIVTAAQANNGEIAQEMLRVSGIFSFGDRNMDGRMAFIHIDKARTMLNLEGQTHLLVLNFDGPTPENDHPFWKELSSDTTQALSWRKIMKELSAILEMTDINVYIASVILFSMVALIIMNALFMSLYERLYEFGVLAAVGTRRRVIAGLIFVESFLMALLSIGAGWGFGAAISFYVKKNGIDYAGIEYAGVTMTKVIYPVITINPYLYTPFFVLFFTFCAALYPAYYASKISPSSAMGTYK